MTLSEIMRAHDVFTVDEAVPLASVFGLDMYPIFDEAHRDILNRKIIARFWDREIGQETDEKFRMRMDTRMREIMVEHNQRYLTEQIKFDPMHTIDIRTVMGETGSGTLHGTASSNQDTTDNATTTTLLDGTTSGKSDTTTDGTKDTTTSATSDSTSDKSTNSRAVSSVMPQNQLSGNGDYADNASDSVATANDVSHSETGGESNETDHATQGVIESGTTHQDGSEVLERTGSTDQTGTTDSNTTSKTDRTSSTIGYQAMPAQLLQQYRDTIMNIDLDILGLLERQFMAVVSTGDEYFFKQGNAFDYPYWNGYGYL